MSNIWNESLPSINRLRAPRIIAPFWSEKKERKIARLLFEEIQYVQQGEFRPRYWIGTHLMKVTEHHGSVGVNVIWRRDLLVVNNPLFVNIFLLFNASLRVDQENEDDYNQKTRSRHAKDNTEVICVTSQMSKLFLSSLKIPPLNKDCCCMISHKISTC